MAARDEARFQWVVSGRPPSTPEAAIQAAPAQTEAIIPPISWALRIFLSSA
jgi:hypothetical protein